MALTQRINMILKANINNMLDRTENPERMLKLFRRELEDTSREVHKQRARIVEESRRLESMDHRPEGLDQEMIALQKREAELAESQAALAECLGRIQGRLMVHHNGRGQEHQPSSSATRPFPDSSSFDQAVHRFERYSLRMDREFRKLEAS